jgi:predicted ATPase/DNA-binding XRE family transcriptional regulator
MSAAGGEASFADLLRQRRRAAGLTQEALAERSGVSVRAVSNLEREINQRPHRDTVAMLADGLGLDGAARTAFLAVARPRSNRSPDREPTTVPALPERRGALLGRERELRAIETILDHPAARLLTLTGPGGVGKTRLAVEIAHDLADRYADGVRFVRLDGIADPALVLPALAGALGLRETGGGPFVADRLAAHLADRELLLILDNLEHLLAAAPALADLLDRVPGVTVLATSREALRVRGEQVFVVAPLPRPDPDAWRAEGALPDPLRSPAIALFARHAAAAGAELALDPAAPGGRGNVAAIAEICHRLDGLPLAIELAAAQSQALSPAAILAMMNGAGLPLLAAGGRDQPARLRTMEAAIALGYALLSAEEQAVFRALAVFVSGFSLPAAAAVAGEPGAGSAGARDPLVWHGSALAGTIAALAGKHLLIQDDMVPDHAAPRFRLLEPIRLFALERLREAGEEAAVRRRHAAYFAALAELLDALTLGPDPAPWFQRLALDHDNFRAAQDWALAAGCPELAVRIVCGAGQFWEITGLLSEGRWRVAAALAVDDGSPPDRRWFLRYWAGTLAFHAGDFAAADAFARELLAIAEAHDDPLGMGVGLAQLSRAIGADPARHMEAADLAQRAVATLAPLGHDEWTGSAWSRLGTEYHRLGRLAEARDCYQRGLEVRRRRGCDYCAAYSLASLGMVALDLGEPAAAVAAFRESLGLALADDDQTLLLAALLGLADTAWRYGEGATMRQRALRFLGAALTRLDRHGFGQTPAARDALARWQSATRRTLGVTQVERLLAAGAALPLPALTALAAGLRVGGEACGSTGLSPEPLPLAILGSID